MMLKKIALLATLPLAFAAVDCESTPTCEGAESNGKNVGCVAAYSHCKTCAADLTDATTPTQKEVIDRKDDNECGSAGDKAGLKDCCIECADGYLNKLDGDKGTDGVDCEKCTKANCKTCTGGKDTCDACMAGYTIKSTN